MMPDPAPHRFSNGHRIDRAFRLAEGAASSPLAGEDSKARLALFREPLAALGEGYTLAESRCGFPDCDCAEAECAAAGPRPAAARPMWRDPVPIVLIAAIVAAAALAFWTGLSWGR